MRIYHVTYQLVPKQRRRTRVITTDRDFAVKDAKCARRASILVWEDHRLAEIYPEGTDFDRVPDRTDNDDLTEREQ